MTSKMLPILYVYGAYGRNASLKDWQDGKDFMIAGSHGTYCSKRDLEFMRERGVKAVALVDQIKDETICFIDSATGEEMK